METNFKTEVEEVCLTKEIAKEPQFQVPLTQPRIVDRTIDVVRTPRNLD